jgi:DNA-binding LytR/AlgR family response regulator
VARLPPAVSRLRLARARRSVIEGPPVSLDPGGQQKDNPAFMATDPANAAHGPESRHAARMQLIRGVLVAIAIGLLLAVSGAFYSKGPLWHRVAYWVPLMVGGTLIGEAISARAIRLERLAGSPWLTGVIMTLTVGAAMVVVVTLWSNLLFAGGASLRNIPFYLMPVLVVTAVMTTITMLLNRPMRETHAAPPSAPASGSAPPLAALEQTPDVAAQPALAPVAEVPAGVRLRERLPPRLSMVAIRAVEADDHYLKVHTSGGTEHILMRLADALAELEGIEGAQVHRSWWVARDGFERVERRDGKVVLVLPGGTEAPVSRTHLRALREAGWFG